MGGHPQEEEGRVAVVMSDPAPVRQPSIPSLLEAEPLHTTPESFGAEQHKDPQLLAIIHFLVREELPLDTAQARKICQMGLVSPRWL